MALPAFWMNLLEVSALLSGLACVWLLIRQNVWTFPIGLLFALISVYLLAVAHLYADVLLSSYYVLMNAYGWYYWLRGGRPVDARQAPVSRIPARWWWWIAPATVLGILIMGYLFNRYTAAELVYWDSTTTILSFVAMWMTARKYIENWVLWFVVDILSTGIYAVKGLPGYTLLYAVYLLLAVMGWRAWREALKTQPSSA